MKPLARITDPTAHLLPGTITGPGAPLVMAHGLPVARALDTAACGKPGDPPGSIQTGSADVLIHGLPASALGDSVVCGATVSMGAPQVFVGGASVTIPLNIQGSDDFIKQTQAAVATLYSTPTGKQLFADIAASGHQVTIQETTDPNGYCKPHFDPLGNAAKPGKGVGSTVSWNPSHPAPGLAGNPNAAAVVLGHELVHAHHNATGTHGNGPDDSYPGQNGSSSRGEERKTVGCKGGTITQPNGVPTAVPDHSKDIPTENSFRRDLGLPPRNSYYPNNWPGGPPW
ncbi:MAG: PAAR domain-containing protein [Polyangiaceae bacterium]|nr:PAAR domain-containing protein [Polyangiaceae bacterium]